MHYLLGAGPPPRCTFQRLISKYAPAPTSALSQTLFSLQVSLAAACCFRVVDKQSSTHKCTLRGGEKKKKKKLLKIIDEHSTLELFLFLDARRQCRPRSRRGRRFVSQRLTFPQQQQPCRVTFSLRSEGHFFFLVCFPFVDITFGSAADVAGGTYTCITPGFLVHSRCRMDALFFCSHSTVCVYKGFISCKEKSCAQNAGQLLVRQVGG